MVKTLPDPAALEDNTATPVETLLLGRVDGKKIYLDLDTNLGGIRSWNFKRMFDEEIAEVCLVMPHLLALIYLPPRPHQELEVLRILTTN